MTSDNSRRLSSAVRAFVLALLAFSLAAPAIATAAPSHLVISEIYITDTSHTVNRDFVEIFNPTETTLSLDSVRLSNADTADDPDGVTYAFPAGAAIGPGKVIVVAHRAVITTGYSFFERFGFLPTYEIVDSTATVPNMTQDFSYGEGGATLFYLFALADDGCALLDASANYAVIDAASWGSTHYGTQPFTASVPANSSLERLPADADTDDCSADFVIRSSPNPGAILVLGASMVKMYRVNYGTGPRYAAHPFGLWNNPYQAGIEAYNYNMPQDYTSATVPYFGPHGGYATTSHRCRECHAVHRASGSFKLTRADSRVDACDWCHGLGAGSGFNVQMDNDDALTHEFDTGHTLGFGTSDGRWKSPDDTDPAYTPPFYRGGFSCLDCHSVHANPARIMLDVVEHRLPYTLTQEARGRYMLLKNPDVETTGGGEISDDDTSTTVNGYPVNKIRISWTNPYGPNNAPSSMGGGDPNYYNPNDRSFVLSEFCTDCHDGNAGFHRTPARIYSEERAAVGDPDPYKVGYGHDSQPRDVIRQKEYEPRDNDLFGPSCLNCHRGGSSCTPCHGPGGANYSTTPNTPSFTPFAPDGFWKMERAVNWPANWYDQSATVSPQCADNGFTYPHRTLGFKMLKDEMFGLNFNGTETVGPGTTRSVQPGAPTSISGQPAHNLDSACIECHNPSVWNTEYPRELIFHGIP